MAGSKSGRSNNTATMVSLRSPVDTPCPPGYDPTTNVIARASERNVIDVGIWSQSDNKHSFEPPYPELPTTPEDARRSLHSLDTMTKLSRSKPVRRTGNLLDVAGPADPVIESCSSTVSDSEPKASSNSLLTVTTKIGEIEPLDCCETEGIAYQLDEPESHSAEQTVCHVAPAAETDAAFDPDFYRTYYPDLSTLSNSDLLAHYHSHGAPEGRPGNSLEALKQLEDEVGPLPADFDESHYLAENSDVTNLYGSFARGGAIHFLRYGRSERRNYRKVIERYDEHLLNLMTNRIHDLPDIEVNASAKPKINVLVPAFDFKTMSAGFFGVFQVARFIAKCDYLVRLVMFDNFYWNESEFRIKLLDFPGMEQLFDELEIAYIGSRENPLVISPFDNCVATVWYSAYFAEKIMNRIGSRPFLYLIQDYETNFYPGGSLFSFADESYTMNFAALFSSKPLQETFLRKEIGIFKVRPPKYTYFNNACASHLLDKEDFITPRSGKRRLAFYSRPAVNRNMFELGALALCQASRLGFINADEWEVYGVGIGDITIELGHDLTLKQMPRMHLKDYQKAVASFDLGLCLMASPHPSLLPFDLAGSGALVVTNEFGEKTREYFNRICENIICKKPNLNQILAGIREAVSRIDDRGRRYEAAKRMDYPVSWDETFGPDHKAFIRDVFTYTSIL